jgi:hypothetical protein
MGLAVPLTEAGLAEPTVAVSPEDGALLDKGAAAFGVTAPLGTGVPAMEVEGLLTGVVAAEPLAHAAVVRTSAMAAAPAHN